MTGVRITIELGEIATGNLHLNAMSLLKYVARRPQVNRVLVHFIWRQQLLFLKRIPVPCSDDPVLLYLCIPVWMNVDKFASKVGIFRCRSGVQLDQKPSGHL